MVVQYKCPSCGADMVFLIQSQRLFCESCGHTENIETQGNNSTIESGVDFEESTPETSQNTYNETEASQYHCNNCGASLITSKETTATSCTFCGAPMILGDRLTGSLAPSYIIPFSISKSQAQEAFRKWCHKGLLTPKGFMSADRIKNITGIYVPFWLFDLNGIGEARAICTQVRTYEDSNYTYTETKYYDVYRKVDLNYLKIPADASEKMEDLMMDKLEPFYYNNLKEFKIPYLAGYISEKYNFTDQQLFPRVKQRTKDYVESFLNSTIHGYTATAYQSKWIDIRQKRADYVLLPVWMICYDYKNAEHNFAMNGQTGKIAGKPPISGKKVALWWTGCSAVIFLLLHLFPF